MANTSNHCAFEGRISKDPQYSQISTKNGPMDKVVFDIAVDRGMSAAQKQEAQSNGQSTADFVHCEMVGARVASFRQWFGKGKAIKVFAHYVQYQYQDKNTGQTQYGHKFDVDDWGFVTQDAKNTQQGGQPNQGGYQQQNYNNNNGYNQNNNYQQPPQNFMNMPQPQQQDTGNFQMWDQSNSASPF